MTYRDELQEAVNKLRELENLRSAVEKQIRAYTVIVESLQELGGEEKLEDRTAHLDLDPVGFTDAVRMILKHHLVPMSPPEIRDSLLAGGINGSSQKHLLINVHTVLRRLVEAGEVQEAERKGEKVFQWVSGLRRALLELGPSPIAESKSRTAQRNLERSSSRIRIRS